jgi:predicted RNase H-like HicB family nuclease
MRTFTAVVERDPETGLFVGYVPGWAGAHSQGATLDELRENLREVISMLLEDGDPRLEAEFVGTQSIAVWCHACRFLNPEKSFARWSALDLLKPVNGEPTGNFAIRTEELQQYHFIPVGTSLLRYWGRSLRT